MTKGPNEFKGDIGKQMETCHELRIVEFTCTENNLPPGLDTKQDISSDQMCLLEMCTAVSSVKQIKSQENWPIHDGLH